MSGFEDYRPPRRFGLLICGQAWHWIDPAVRWERAAAAVVPGGALAFFWNMDRPADEATAEVLRTAHERHAPQVWQDQKPVQPPDLVWAEADDQPALADGESRLYTWVRTQTVEEYLDYLSTHSIYVLLDAAVREALFDDIRAGLGDRIVSDVDTMLYLARRATGSGQ